jgi:DNA-binding response OmpR family regulator
MISRELVLMVDTEEEHLAKLTKCLTEFNMDTVTAETGALGKKYSLELEPNIIISEIDLPDISGFDLCRELQAHSKTANIPLLFATWRDQEIDRVVGFELGATDYVVKPIIPKEVALRVTSILRRLRGNNGRRLFRVGQVVIDLEQSIVLDRGQRLGVSATEFAILAALARAKGRVLSRTEIIERAWKEPSSVMKRTVDAHIKSLRAKLKHTGLNIVTIRRLGYCLRAPQVQPAATDDQSDNGNDQFRSNGGAPLYTES